MIVHNLRPESSSVSVPNVTEVVCAIPPYKERDGDGFDGGVAPAAKVDASLPVDIVDEVTVLTRPPEVKVRDFEVVPEHEAVRHPEPAFDLALVNVSIDGRPETDIARPIVGGNSRVAVLNATVAHHSEDVVVDPFGDVRVVIQPPDVLQSGKDRLLIHSLGMEATHVTITNCLGTAVFRHRCLVEKRRNVKMNYLQHTVKHDNSSNVHFATTPVSQVKLMMMIMMMDALLDRNILR